MRRWMALSGYALLVTFASWWVLAEPASSQAQAPPPAAPAALARLVRDLSADLRCSAEGSLRRLTQGELCES